MSHLEVSPGPASQRIIAALTRLTREGASAFPQGVLATYAQVAAEAIGRVRCSVMMLDDSRRYLLCKASSGLTRSEENVSFRVGEGIAGWVAEHARALRLNDVNADRRYVRLPGPGIQSLLCVPLLRAGEILGALSMSSLEHDAFSAEDEALLTYLGSALVRDLESARLRQLSITDPLTQAYNRQYLYERLSDACVRAPPLSVIAFDIDHFKRLNDDHGHDAGDVVLRRLAALARSLCADTGELVRHGGEEFVVLLPRVPLASARDLAERIRGAVAEAVFAWGERALSVTLSAGVTCATTTVHEPGSLLRRADELLYTAKRAGRNRVVAEPAETGGHASEIGKSRLSPRARLPRV